MKHQALLKIDPVTDERISQAAHFLGMTQRDFLVQDSRLIWSKELECRPKDGRVDETADGSLTSGIATLTGLSP